MESEIHDASVHDPSVKDASSNPTYPDFAEVLKEYHMRCLTLRMVSAAFPGSPM